MHTLLIFAPCFIEIYGSWNPFQICNSKICEKSFIGKIFYFVRIQDMQTFTFSDKWLWCANSIEFGRPSIILKEYYTFPYCLKISEKRIGRMTLQHVVFKAFVIERKTSMRHLHVLLTRKLLFAFFCIFLKTIITSGLDILWEINNSLKHLLVIWLYIGTSFFVYFQQYKGI